MKNKKKRRYYLPTNEINVVSLMDILTTMLFFLLAISSFHHFSALVGSSDMGVSSKPPQHRFDLVIAAKSSSEIEVHLGAISHLKGVNVDILIRDLKHRGYKGGVESGFKKILTEKDWKVLQQKIITDLIDIKKAFPHEMKSTLVMKDQVNYQQMIDLMGIMTELPTNMPDLIVENLLGKPQKLRQLFPEVALQEWGG